MAKVVILATLGFLLLQDADPEAVEGPVIDEVARRFGDDDVARIEKHLADEIEELLRTGADDDLVYREPRFAARLALEAQVMLEDFFAERGVAFGGAVLQRRSTQDRVGENLVESGFRFGNGERGLIDQAGGEADQIRMLDGGLHEITDRLIVGMSGPLGKTHHGHGDLVSADWG